MYIAQMMDSGLAHSAALVASLVIGWFLSSGNPLLTVTFGSVLKILYSDLVNWANA